MSTTNSINRTTTEPMLAFVMFMIALATLGVLGMWVVNAMFRLNGSAVQLNYWQSVIVTAILWFFIWFDERKV